MSSVLWNATEDVERLRGHFAEMLRGRIAAISDLSGVPAEFIEPINPCDHLIRNSYIEIDGYPYKNEDKFYAEKPREIFRVSPLDEPRKTAEQIAYKHNENAVRIGARKCKVAFVGKAALSFYSANHRQGLMNTTANAVSAALLHDGEIVALMTYDKTAGGVRGAKRDYELLRLAIKRGSPFLAARRSSRRQSRTSCATWGKPRFSPIRTRRSTTATFTPPSASRGGGVKWGRKW